MGVWLSLQRARISGLNFTDEEISETSNSCQVMGVGSWPLLLILFQVFERIPSDEIDRQCSLAISGGDLQEFGEIFCRVKRLGKVAKSAKLEPLLKLRIIPMQCNEVLEIVKGETKVGDAVSLLSVVIRAMIVVPVVKIKIRPYFNRRIPIMFPKTIVMLSQRGKSSAFSDSPARSN